MSSSLMALAIVVTLGQVPYGAQPVPYGAAPQVPYGAVGYPPSPYPSDQATYVPNATGIPNGGLGPVTATGGQYGREQLYPFDAYENWVHGHWQEIPAYGGYHFYRPYNYKHVLAQSQISGGWGMSPTMPYSHEYFRRVAAGQPAGTDHRLGYRQNYYPPQNFGRRSAVPAGVAPIAPPARTNIVPVDVRSAGVKGKPSRVDVNSAVYVQP